MGFVSHLRLRQFRNYDSLDVRFPPGLTVLAGDNGLGKSNLLEAIHYLAVLRSFRTRSAAELRRWGGSYFCIEGLIAAEGSAGGTLADHRLSVIYGERRRLRRDGKLVARASAFINTFLCVAFAPEDIGLIKAGPHGRRRFMDLLLSQSDPDYLLRLVNYTVALQARNAMLRSPAAYGDKALAAYDQVMAENGAPLIQARHRFVEELRPRLAAAADTLAGTPFHADLHYTPTLGRRRPPDETVATLAGEMLDQWRRSRNRDAELGFTRLGPHRDEFEFLLAGRPAGVFGSEGQCRLLALALKQAAADRLAACTGRGLVVLIDDVLGELDRRRRTNFLHSFPRAQQIFLACTEPPPDIPCPQALFTVADGRLVQSTLTR